MAKGEGRLVTTAPSGKTSKAGTAMPDAVAPMTDEEIEAEIRRYEAKYQMTSDEFLSRRKQGTAPDTFETTDWAILLKHRR